MFGFVNGSNLLKKEKSRLFERQNGEHAMTADIVLEIESPTATVVLLNGTTEAGRQWLDANVYPEAQRWAGRVVCEHRYVADVVNGARADGLNVETEGTT